MRLPPKRLAVSTRNGLVQSVPGDILGCGNLLCAATLEPPPEPVGLFCARFNISTVQQQFEPPTSQIWALNSEGILHSFSSDPEGVTVNNFLYGRFTTSVSNSQVEVQIDTQWLAIEGPVTVQVFADGIPLGPPELMNVSGNALTTYDGPPSTGVSNYVLEICGLTQIAVPPVPVHFGINNNVSASLGLIYPFAWHTIPTGFTPGVTPGFTLSNPAAPGEERVYTLQPDGTYAAMDYFGWSVSLDRFCPEVGLPVPPVAFQGFNNLTMTWPGGSATGCFVADQQI